MDLVLAIALIVAALIIGAAVSGFIFFRMGIEHRKRDAEAQIESAEVRTSHERRSNRKLCALWSLAGHPRARLFVWVTWEMIHRANGTEHIIRSTGL